MSRIGKKPVVIPAGVTAKVDGQSISVKGGKGELSFIAPDHVSVALAESKIAVTPRNDSKQARAMWGMTRSIVNNLVTGVSKGFERKLEITGVGYKAAVSDKNLQLSLGYSHDVTSRFRRESRSPRQSRRKFRSLASTSARLGKPLRKSVPCARPNLTRARASNMPMNLSSARKARRSRRDKRQDWVRMAKDNNTTSRRQARVRRSLRAHAYGKPRLTVFRSSKQIYCQIIDDGLGRTLAAASSLEKANREGLKTGATRGVGEDHRPADRRARGARPE